MLSVLIPIYNTDVNPLVRQIWHQAEKLDLFYEIILLDDGSTSSFRSINASLSSFNNVSYHEATSNQGRARSRNQLVELAQNPILLFLDDDSRLMREDFLSQYLQHAGGDIVVGGRRYSRERPSPDKMLHWRYGRKRECRSLEVRNSNAQLYFHSNNFLAPRTIMQEVPFDDNLIEYGYEDILLAKQLVASGYHIRHIDNPVLHDELDSNSQFLAKHRAALAGLARLGSESISLGTRLEKSQATIWPPLLRMNVRAERVILRHLGTAFLPLILFDMRRLAWFCTEIDKLEGA